jgi:hypothetical protein
VAFHGAHGPVQLDYPLGTALVLPLFVRRLRSQTHIGDLGEEGVVFADVVVVVIVAVIDGDGVVADLSSSSSFASVWSRVSYILSTKLEDSRRLTKLEDSGDGDPTNFGRTQEINYGRARGFALIMN